MVAPKVHELLNPTDWGPLYWEANGFTPQQASAMFDFASAVIGEINLWHMSIEIIGDRRYVTLGILAEEFTPDPELVEAPQQELDVVFNDQA